MEISISQEELTKIKAEGGSVISYKDWKKKVEFIPTQKNKWAKRRYFELSNFRDIYSKVEFMGKSYSIKLSEELADIHINKSNK